MAQNVTLEPFTSYMSLDQYLLSEQREYLLGALTETRWNHTAAAALLGITLRAIRYRVEQCGLLDKPWAGKVRRARFRLGSFEDGWPRVRWAALKRDNFRCQACGVAAKDGARLHVDHIKPKRHFPELALELSNVQVLCETCNLSKGSEVRAT